MGKLYDEITPDLSEWLEEQKVFFVATAPVAADGLINCSPKGMDTFRVLAPKEVAYLDLTGSGIETAAHLRENGRMVFMFCALSGPPKIVRLHGDGEVVTESHPDFEELMAHFPDVPGARCVIRCHLTRISDSCGFGVPLYKYAGERDTLTRWAESIKEEGLADYRQEHNRRSLDGLPGLDANTG